LAVVLDNRDNVGGLTLDGQFPGPHQRRQARLPIGEGTAICLHFSLVQRSQNESGQQLLDEEVLVQHHVLAQARTEILENLDRSSVRAGTGDFDGNGSTDILWRDNNTGTVAIWLLGGLQVSQTGSLGAVPSNWLIATTGDYLKA